MERPEPRRVRAASALPWCLWLLTGCGAGEAPRPNLLLISIDTLRADHLGCYGYAPYDQPVSPAIDGLAAEGLRFERMFAPRGQTAPSLCSMMTGKYPSSHGVRENGQSWRGEHETWAGVLGEAGYDTAAFVSVVPDARTGSPKDGFARAVEANEVDATASKSGCDAQVARWGQEFLTQRRTDAAPFFLWLHFYDVHRPYYAPPPFTGAFRGAYDGPLGIALDGTVQDRSAVDDHLSRKALEGEPLAPADEAFAVALYDGGIRSTDEHVKDLLAALDQEGLAEDTLVILVADHGDELGEHGHYWFHGNSVYDGTLRIPCILRWPGVIPAGGALDHLAQNLDLMPTVLELLDLAAPPGVEGVSFASQVRSGGGAPPREWVYTEWQDLIVTVRNEEWKYVFNPLGVHPKKPPFHLVEGRDFPIRCEELYHVATDPGEQEDVHAEHAALVRDLRRRALDWRDRPGAVKGWQSTEDAELLRDLLAQGYVGTLPGRPDVVFGAETCR